MRQRSHQIVNNLLYTFIFTLLLTPFSFLEGFNKEPWLPEPWHPDVFSSFTYTHFSQVSHAVPPLSHSIFDQNIRENFEVVLVEDVSLEIEVDFAKISHIDWGYRDAAVQVRYQLLDDILGDPISCTVGVNYRNVSPRMLHSVSTPYHGTQNFEGNIALGKEWTKNSFWDFRAYLFEGIGSATVGSLWSWTRIAIEKNFKDQQRISLFCDGYFGFGPRKEVPIDHFHGYARIHHQSIDLGLAVRQKISYFGELSLAYFRNVFARSFPKGSNSFTLLYKFSF